MQWLCSVLLAVCWLPRMTREGQTQLELHATIERPVVRERPAKEMSFNDGGSIRPLPQIGLPLSGIKSANLRDSFNELHNGHQHRAIDLMAPRGTPVLAVTGGRIEKLFLSKSGGNTIYEFDDSNTYCYYYAHLDRYADGISEHLHVSPGTVIGYVGSTGDASPNAPHLHFAIYRLDSSPRWWNGTPIDPYPVLLLSLNRTTEPLTSVTHSTRQ